MQMNFNGSTGSSPRISVQMRYQNLLREGKAPKDAAKIAQAETGYSLVTGRPINGQIPYKEKYVGQYQYP